MYRLNVHNTRDEKRNGDRKNNKSRCKKITCNTLFKEMNFTVGNIILSRQIYSVRFIANLDIPLYTVTYTGRVLTVNDLRQLRVGPF